MKEYTKREVCLNITGGVCFSEYNKKAVDEYLDKIREIEMLVLWRMTTDNGKILSEMDTLKKDVAFGNERFDRYVNKLKNDLYIEIEELPIKIPGGLKVGDLLNLGNTIKKMYLTIRSKVNFHTHEFMENYNPKCLVGYRYNKRSHLIELKLFGRKADISIIDTKWEKLKKKLIDRSGLGAILERDGFEYYLYI